MRTKVKHTLFIHCNFKYLNWKILFKRNEQLILKNEWKKWVHANAVWSLRLGFPSNGPAECPDSVIHPWQDF